LINFVEGGDGDGDGVVLGRRKEEQKLGLAVGFIQRPMQASAKPNQSSASVGFPQAIKIQDASVCLLLILMISPK
jgi:hypothetical protein